jgi:conjugal transfer mating pair stabilization protein TraN
MEGQVTLGENHDAVPGDPPEIYAFPGFAQACTSNILVNCCNTEAAQEVSQQIDTAITAVQMAMNAYKVATAIQSFYVATTTMMQVYGYTMVHSAQLVASQMMSTWAASMFAISWTGVVMVIVVVVMMIIQMLMQCDEASTETAIKSNLDLCVDVGDYCATKLLFGCFKRRHAKCCFPSLLAKIIQVQGRAQLAAMPMTSPPRDPQCLAEGRYPDVGWGDPRSPNCRGLTVCELQAIDWERIDWSEYLEQLQRRISQPTRDQVTRQADDPWRPRTSWARPPPPSPSTAGSPIGSPPASASRAISARAPTSARSSTLTSPWRGRGRSP